MPIIFKDRSLNLQLIQNFVYSPSLYIIEFWRVWNSEYYKNVYTKDIHHNKSSALRAQDVTICKRFSIYDNLKMFTTQLPRDHHLNQYIISIFTAGHWKVCSKADVTLHRFSLAYVKEINFSSTCWVQCYRIAVQQLLASS